MANNDRATGHQRIDHTFNNELLSYDAGIHYQRQLRAPKPVRFIRRKLA